MTFPLESVLVLDLSRLAPGPHCTMILGDLGAEVIKIEEPGGGRRAILERAQTPTQREEEERRVAFNAHERNKKSLVLNLKSPEAKEVFYRLAQKADVIVEGFRPGVVRRLGVDYETISRKNPRIIYCGITGYGQDGPYQNVVGHDINYIAVAGALSLTGEKGRAPVPPSNLLGDYAGGGLSAALGILAALLAREKTGRGQYVDISMTDGVLGLLTPEAATYFATDVVPSRGETRLTGAVPYYAVYETKDGQYISVGCNEPYFYENLCRALGREDYVAHQYTPDEKLRAEIFDYFRKTFRTKTRDEWFEALRDQDICIAPVYTLDETFTDPQIRHRQMVVELEHPTLGKVRQVGIPFKLSETPGKVRSLAPRRGEHTAEILKGLGYSPQAIQTMVKSGAVGLLDM